MAATIDQNVQHALGGLTLQVIQFQTQIALKDERIAYLEQFEPKDANEKFGSTEANPRFSKL